MDDRVPWTFRGGGRTHPARVLNRKAKAQLAQLLQQGRSPVDSLARSQNH